MPAEFETPEFVAWCVIRPCLLRGRFELDNPIAADRQLKSIRALSAGIASDRIYGPWCLDRPTASGDFSQPRGFAVEDVASRWHGTESIAAICEACESNFESQHALSLGPKKRTWAGCFGWLALRGSLVDLPDRIASSHAASSDLLHPWARLWSHRRLSGSRANEVADVLTSQIAHHEHGEADEEGLDDPHRLIAALRSATQIADENSMGGVAVLHMPAGIVRGKDWEWPSHCRVCMAPKGASNKGCSRCGDRSAPLSLVRRRSRGIRPYRDLTELLSAEGLAELATQVQSRRGI